MSYAAATRRAQDQKKWCKLAEGACKDAELKQRLLNDPTRLLREDTGTAPTVYLQYTFKQVFVTSIQNSGS
jgi:hypothetical protein